MYFGPDGRLFGVLTQGAAQAIQHGRPAPVVLLLSGGVNPQVGTNRMHTTWARRWAAEGVTSFRFDLSGIGDSGNAAGGQDSQLYSVDTVRDVQAAMDHLEAAAGAQRFVLIGLCSGAFAAFHTALADVRVESIALLNLLRFYWGAEDTVERVQAERRRQLRSVRYYVSALFWPSTWRKLVGGTVNLRGILKHMTLRAGRRVQAVTTYYTGRLGFSGAPSSKLASDFRVLARRSLKSLVIYDGHEPMLDDFQEQLGSDAPRLRALGLLELAVIDESDHIFSPVRSQEALAQLLTEHVRARVLG
jgi:pimeloyl-ACP methyl ester carboxylesterase